MEGGESILDSLYEEEGIGDVDMLDVEEGECIEENPHNEKGQSSGGDVNVINQESQSGKRRHRKNRRNRKKKSGSAPQVTDINRFVLECCKRLKEKKSYMVYTAVGCLGVSALSDFIKEVYAIQACGGQMTADGRRYRTGGGILWGIIKAREPNAYREIMKKAKEFEKQFRQQNIKQEQKQNQGASQETAIAFTDQTTDVLDGAQLVPQMQSHLDNSIAEGKRISVHNRVRIPVSYDDLLGEDPKED